MLCKQSVCVGLWRFMTMMTAHCDSPVLQRDEKSIPFFRCRVESGKRRRLGIARGGFARKSYGVCRLFSRNAARFRLSFFGENSYHILGRLLATH